jgi:hypothetical protein
MAFSPQDRKADGYPNQGRVGSSSLHWSKKESECFLKRQHRPANRTPAARGYGQENLAFAAPPYCTSMSRSMVSNPTLQNKPESKMENRKMGNGELDSL